MCGLIGAVSSEDVVDNLLEGLKYLEYRGYDSSGIATFHPTQKLQYHRVVGKVNRLSQALLKTSLSGNIGIAHTRWATHGKPSEVNAHPQCAYHEVAVVHNGVIENYLSIKSKLSEEVSFTSETDTEILAWLLYQQLQTENNLLKAAQKTLLPLQGSFSAIFLLRDAPKCLIGVRKKSPLIIGLGKNKNFLASDKVALLPFTKRFIHLEDGDIAIVYSEKITIYNAQGILQNRPIISDSSEIYSFNKGSYLSYMEKEIHEQPKILNKILKQYIQNNVISLEPLQQHLPQIRHIHLTGCGSSYHAALLGRFWIEKLSGIPCYVEVASEFRYRQMPVPPDTLLITLSQSGETADTLGVLREAKQQGKYKATLTLCNVTESSLARESDWVLPIYAGIEIGVAATKSFLAQLNTLLLLAFSFKNSIKNNLNCEMTQQFLQLPSLIKKTLSIENDILQIAKRWQHKDKGLLIARSEYYPIALEGALKLKETTYIHIEACPAGELKHGTLALLTDQLPVIILAPDDDQLSKMQVCIEEILARGADVLIFSGEKLKIQPNDKAKIIRLPYLTSTYFNPFVYTIPLQYLAFHIAHLKGIDMDQPRHLAKSVTVE